ncbi:MAG: c-type cytochrome [Rhodobacteraceae bacterium]|nr:c-type cytochrome [Paracoccaceae bacterium]
MKSLPLTAVLAAAIIAAAPGMAQDVVAGQKIFKKCAACHTIGEGAKNGAGPVLNDIIGRPAGTFEGFNYGKGMKEASEKGLVWDAEKISEYITDPKKYLRAFTGNKRAKAKMKFKVKDNLQRLDVIAYISTFSTSAMTAQTSEEKGDTDRSILIPSDIPANAICVQNAGHGTHFFAVDGGGDSRKAGHLASGETLCTGALEMAMQGKVSVFETEDHLEGCTRLVPSGTVEQMLKYADFDRCLWSSNDG